MVAKKILAIVQIVCIIFLNVSHVPLAKADDSDIFGSNISPNVLILFDDSGSMSDTVPAAGYTSGTTYSTPSTYSTNKVYRKYTSKKSCKPNPKPCYKVYADTVAEVNSSAAQSALSTAVTNSSGFWSGSISGSNVDLFIGNYLNYKACSNCSTSQQKIVVAKRVVKNLINNVDGVRFGVMKFKYSPSYGATMVAPIGSDKTTITTAVDALTPSGVTPLWEQLKDAGDYFKGTYPGYSSPIQYECQPNFVILMTDGEQNPTSSVNNIKLEATNRYKEDHASGLTGKQNVIVHTVGFNISSNSTAVNDLKDAAKNGGGSYYTAESETELEQSLEDAISQIMAATFSFATPLVPTTGTSGTSRAYLASFQSNPSRPFWRGYLKAYNRDSNGLIPVDANGVPSGTPAWEAGQVLNLPPQSPASRNIFTVVGGTVVGGTVANATKQSFTTSNTAITDAMLGAANSTEKNFIINFVRGTPDTNDENLNLNTTEDRPWKLGDIFHSTPVLVSPPYRISGDTSYNAFKVAQAGRTSILLAGANDGMLHAFKESDGSELWGFIPPPVLDDLKDLTANSGSHEFTVDSSPIAADVKIGGSWKTIVIFGQRRGGTNYFALDITDTTNPQHLWTFSDARLGETWSEPSIGRIKMSDGTDKFVAFVGGGFDSTFANYDSGNVVSEAFFVIDLATGLKLWEFSSTVANSADAAHMNFSIPAAPTAVDLNGDGYIDRVYVADVGGQIWKFDVSKSASLVSGTVKNCTSLTDTNCWMGKRLFLAAASQANPPVAGQYYPAQGMFATPSLAYSAAGDLWMYIGSGDRYHPNNASSNRLYGIKENTSMANGSALTEASLTNLSSGTGTITQGWYVPLNSNEKVLASADVFNGIVLFTSFTPATAAVCGGGGGTAKLYAINMTGGDAALNLTNGTVPTPGTAALTMAKTIGTGIPSRPIIIMSDSGNTFTPYVIAGTTNQQISTTGLIGGVKRRLVGWREVF